MTPLQYEDLRDRMHQTQEVVRLILLEYSECRQSCRYPLLTASNRLEQAMDAIERSYLKHPKQD